MAARDDGFLRKPAPQSSLENGKRRSQFDNQSPQKKYKPYKKSNGNHDGYRGRGDEKRHFPHVRRGAFKGRPFRGRGGRYGNDHSRYREGDLNYRDDEFKEKTHRDGQPHSKEKRSINYSKLPKGPKSRTDSYAPEKSENLPKITFLESKRESSVIEKVAQVGEGTYGKVYKARNKITGEFVALKKLRLEGEREGFPITAMREIRLLQLFNHPNIISLLEMMVERRNVHMVFDYIGNDLTGILNHPEVKLQPSHCKFLFKQLTEGLEYLHSRRVIHRDIKGSNILIDSSGNIKIADFGLARRMKEVKSLELPDYTNRVITLWYRPPEILMGATDYGREVDIWGIGCLLIELFSKKAPFQGTDEIDQLELIFSVVGTPDTAAWPNIENLPWFELLRPKFKKKSRFRELYGDSKVLPTEACFTLAQKLLTMNPEHRIDASSALKEPYFLEDPAPEALTFLKDCGEWHELDAKKQRRRARKEQEERAKLEKEKEKIADDENAQGAGDGL